MPDQYIEAARETIVGVFGRNGAGYFRSYCGRCHAESPLTDTGWIWGGLPGEVEGECDCCGVSFVDLSARAQREHDEQQAMWSRGARVEYVIEMGVVSAIRCRVY